MLAVERRKEIMEILEKKGSVLVGDLSSRFRVSDETIRRDFKELEKSGYLRKTHGGAVLNNLAVIEQPFQVRSRDRLAEKKEIARAASALIHCNDVIFIDASTTALQVVKYLHPVDNLVVVTNAVEVVLALANKPGVKVHCTGGFLRGKSLSLVGSQAEQVLQRYNINKAFISSQGISIDKGATDSNELEARVKEEAIKAAKKKFLLVDSSKFRSDALITISPVTGFDRIITDHETPGDLLEKIRLLGVEVSVAG